MLTNTDNKSRTSGNGTTTVFSFNFPIFVKGDIKVVLIDTVTSVETTQVLDVDYTVAINTSTEGGTITMTVAPAADEDVLRYRDIEYTQPSQFPAETNFPEERIESMGDRAAMLINQLREAVSRALKLPVSSTLSELTVPTPVAGRGLKWNATADGLENTTADIDTSVAAAQAAQLAAETAASNAATSETNAATSETNAATSGTNAATSETNAATSETNAGLSAVAAQTAQGLAEDARDLAQTYAEALTATSTTSNTIGTGDKTFSIAAGKQFQTGMYMLIVDAGNSANWMFGQVSSYSGSSITVTVTVVGGSGTSSSWQLFISGVRGATGATGATGSTGDAGSVWYTGAGVPNDAVGANGDLYLDTANGDVYQKAAGTWGVAIDNLTGPTGASGSGTGDVLGPATNANNYVPQWDGNNTKTLKDGLAVGTAANNLVQLNASAQLPAVDGSLLTGVASAVDLTTVWANIALLAFRDQLLSSVAVQKMVDGVVDEYEDETGIDAGTSTGELYDATNDLYSPASGGDWDTYTEAVLHCDGIDGSTTITDEVGHTVTAVGNAQIDTAQSKFGGASLLLDGSGDYASLADSDDWFFDTGNFTIDFWVRFNSFGVCTLASQFVDASNYWEFQVVNNGSGHETDLQLLVRSGGTTLCQVYSTTKWSASTAVWYHLEVCRSGTNILVFINGAVHALQTSSSIGSSSFPNYAAALTFGGRPTSGTQVNGWMDEIRVSKGVARHTSAFAAPGAPYEIQGTYASEYKLLLHAEGLDTTQSIIDAATAKAVTAVNQAQLDTADKKFGSSSLLFDGVDDYLTTPDSADWNFSTGDFTVEWWGKTSGTTVPYPVMEQRASNSDMFRIQFANVSGAVLAMDAYSGGSTLFSFHSSVITIAAWAHYAVVRNGNTLKMYQNGIEIGSQDVTGVTMPDVGAALEIGRSVRGGQYYAGWIDELLIIKGVAKYTAAFTPPTSAYVAETSNMVLVSNAVTANTTPTTAQIVLFEEDVDAITLNTDLKVYVSRDAGVTYTQLTLASLGVYDGTKKILSAEGSISAQPSGTSMKYKVETANIKKLKLHGTGLLWQ